MWWIWIIRPFPADYPRLRGPSWFRGPFCRRPEQSGTANLWQRAKRRDDHSLKISIRELQAKHPEELLTIIDGTNTLIANNIMAYVSAVTGTYSAGVMLSILEANGMPADAAMHTYNTFQYGERTLYDPYMSYLSYLIYFIMPHLGADDGGMYLCLADVFCAASGAGAAGNTGPFREETAGLAVRWGYIYVVSALASWIGFVTADISLAYRFAAPWAVTFCCWGL